MDQSTPFSRAELVAPRQGAPPEGGSLVVPPDVTPPVHRWEQNRRDGKSNTPPLFAVPMLQGVDRERWTSQYYTCQPPWIRRLGVAAQVHPGWHPRAEEFRETTLPPQFKKLFPYSSGPMIPWSQLFTRKSNGQEEEIFPGASMLATIQQLGLNIAAALKLLRHWAEKFPHQGAKWEKEEYRWDWRPMLKAVELVRFWLQLIAGPKLVAWIHGEHHRSEVYWVPHMAETTYVALQTVLRRYGMWGEPNRIEPAEDNILPENVVQRYRMHIGSVTEPMIGTALRSGWGYDIWNLERHPFPPGEYVHPLSHGTMTDGPPGQAQVLWDHPEWDITTRLDPPPRDQFTAHQLYDLISRYAMVPLLPKMTAPAVVVDYTEGFPGTHPAQLDIIAQPRVVTSQDNLVGPEEPMEVARQPDWAAGSSVNLPETSAPPDGDGTEATRTESRPSARKIRHNKRRTLQRKQKRQNPPTLTNFGAPPLPPSAQVLLGTTGIATEPLQNPTLHLSVEHLNWAAKDCTPDDSAPSAVAEVLGDGIPGQLQTETTALLDLQSHANSASTEPERTIMWMASYFSRSLWAYSLVLFRRFGVTPLMPQFWEKWIRENRKFGDFNQMTGEGVHQVVEAFTIALFHFFLVPTYSRYQVLVLARERRHLNQGWTVAQEVLSLTMTFAQHGTVQSILDELSPAALRVHNTECQRLASEADSVSRQRRQAGLHNLHQLELSRDLPWSKTFANRFRMHDEIGDYRWESAYGMLAGPKGEHQRLQLRRVTADIESRKNSPRNPKGRSGIDGGPPSGIPATHLLDGGELEAAELMDGIPVTAAEKQRRQSRQYHFNEAARIAAARGCYEKRPGAVDSEETLVHAPELERLTEDPSLGHTEDPIQGPSNLPVPMEQELSGDRPVPQGDGADNPGQQG